MLSLDAETGGPSSLVNEMRTAEMDHNANAAPTGELASIKRLLERLERLEEENRTLREHTGHDVETTPHIPISPTWKTLYRLVDGRVSLSEPLVEYAENDKSKTKLHIDMPLANPSRWLEKQEGLAFVVYKDYLTATSGSAELTNPSKEDDIMKPAESNTESIKLISEPMKEAFKAFVKQQPEFSTHFPDLNVDGEIAAPYRFWYHYRGKDSLQTLDENNQVLMELLTKSIEAGWGPTYQRVDEELSQGRVSKELLDYLVRPGDVLIERKEGRFEAYMALSWTKTASRSSSDEVKQEETSAKLYRSVECWSWAFDGGFYQKTSRLTIALDIPKSELNVDIHKLDVFPLRYAKPEMQSKLKLGLENRGIIQWSCRKQKLVEYLDDDHDHSGIVSDLMTQVPRTALCWSGN